MTPSKTRKTPGFTLVETLVVLVITAIMAVALYQAFYAGRRSHDVQKHLVEMQQNARVALASLADDFRQVSYGKDPTQPSIRYAGPDSIVYIADIMTEIPGAEVISYALDPDGDPDTPNPNDTILMKTVADSGGALLYSEPQSYGINRDGLSFRYFNGAGTEMANPVPQPEMIGEMQVEVTATEAERWKQQPYETMTLSSTIYPRNLPLSPARSRPSTPACGYPTFPNCSSATLTWATPTTNTDGTTLEFGDISHFNFYYGLDPDELSLHARLARTFNSWTIPGLTCETHWIAVTCVSRSGVESYPCRREVVVGGGSAPAAPATLTSTDTGSITLQWPAVTQFEGGEPITVPVEYPIYRSTTQGFEPGETYQIGTATGGATSYVDELPNDCEVYYYRVTASVCCAEGDPSPECSVLRPSLPQCPTNLAGESGTESGELFVSWSHPTHRENLTPLPVDEIAATKVFCDTIPGSAAQYFVLDGNGNSATLTGLAGCKTYYLHARTIDLCGHESGGTCLGNEISVALAEPCDPVVPTAPGYLTLIPMDNRVDLTWPANQVDCDFAGYRVYYGTSSGVYTGADAAEGASPITVTPEQVEQGEECAMSLTDLEGCTTYYVAVTGFDRCDPAHESELSSEAYGMTNCYPCEIQASCLAWVATPPLLYKDVHFEIYTQSGTSETLAKLVPSWGGGALISEVRYGRPLASVWKADGTAGEDGPVGPRPSGSTLNITDVSVPASSSEEDGEPMALFFDQDVRDITFDLVFKNQRGGSCMDQGTNRGAVVFDDFDDGNITGWTVRSGTWSSNNGELYQSSTSSNRLLIGSDVLTNLTFESKICIVSGTTAYIIFRYTNDNNFYLLGLRTDTDIVRLGRMQSGAFTQTASYSTPLSNGDWHNLKVVLSGKRAICYFDCAQVLDYTDNNMNANGKIGFRTSSSSARWDDVRCRNSAMAQ